MRPYFSIEGVTLFLGDAREIALTVGDVDLIVTDPPYGATSLTWDRWQTGWTDIAAAVCSSMWCFGTIKMFLEHASDFATWTVAQDVVWEKHNGAGFASDRFRRVHENAVHFYRGKWSEIHAETQYVSGSSKASTVRSKSRPTHTGKIERTPYRSVDGGNTLMRSVLFAPSMHGKALHPTQKPLGVLEPLIRFGCPPAGVVLDMFAGSGSTLDAARRAGRRCIGIEADERYAEIAANRLSQGRLAI